MAKCNYCGEQMGAGTGKVLIKNDGKLIYLCSSKCEKNLTKLKRKPRDQKWTKKFVKSAETKKGEKK